MDDSQKKGPSGDFWREGGSLAVFRKGQHDSFLWQHTQCSTSCGVFLGTAHFGWRHRSSCFRGSWPFANAAEVFLYYVSSLSILGVESTIYQVTSKTKPHSRFPKTKIAIELSFMGVHGAKFHLTCPPHILRGVRIFAPSRKIWSQQV